MNKIRGAVVGTPIKPEKTLIKATDLTEEQKAQVRANIGAVTLDEVLAAIPNGDEVEY